MLLKDKGAGLMEIQIDQRYKNMTKYCSVDESKPAMNGVFIKQTWDNWYAYATDSFKLIRVPVSVQMDDNDLQYPERWKDGLILPKNIVDHHLKSSSAVRVIDITFNGNNTITSYNSSANEKVVGDVINQTFPPIEDIFTRLSDNKLSVGFTVSNLKDAMLIAGKDSTVKFDVSPDNNLVYADFSNDTDVIIMPFLDKNNGILNRNNAIDLRIQSLKMDLETKQSYLQELLDPNFDDYLTTEKRQDKVEMMIELIDKIRCDIHDQEASKLYFGKDNPYELTIGKFHLEDVIKEGYEIDGLDAVNLVDNIIDMMVNDYSRYLETALNQMNVSKKYIPHAPEKHIPEFRDEEDNGYEQHDEDEVEVQYMASIECPCGNHEQLAGDENRRHAQGFEFIEDNGDDGTATYKCNDCGSHVRSVIYEVEDE
jgi:hypothetical protein